MISIEIDLTDAIVTVECPYCHGEGFDGKTCDVCLDDGEIEGARITGGTIEVTANDFPYHPRRL